MVSERSVGNLALVLVAAAILGASLAFPWFEYDHSTGRRTAEGGFHDPGQTEVVKTHWEARPGDSGGDVASENTKRTDRLVERTGWAIYATIGLLVLAALSELPRIDRILVRRVTLVLDTLAFVAVALLLLVLWYWVPDSFGHGVDDAYTSFLDDSGYTVTEIGMGWVIAAFALPALLGGFLLKFQAGAPDPTVVAELYAQGEL